MSGIAGNGCARIVPEEAKKTLEEIERSIVKRYRKPIWSKFIKAVKDYQLIEEGDKIAVAISGGKDSLLMAKLFQELKKHGQVNFDVEFIAMDPGYHPQIKDLLIDENNLRIDAYYKEHDDFEKEILTSNSYSFNLILESISNYEKLISEIYQLIVKYDSVKKQNEELEDKKYSKELDIKVHKNKLNEALEYLTTIKTETIEKINKYLSNTNTLTIEKNILEEIYNIINSIKDRYEYNKALDLVKESKNNKEEKLKDDKNKLSLKKKEITNDKNKLKTELEKIINDKEVFEENNWFTEAKTILDKEKIPYKKLYECIDFKENLLDEEKKIIESSLLDMGIIDSIIVPNEYRLKAENLLKNNTYKILCKNEKTNKDNLSKYISLEEDNFTKEYSNDIYSIIESISINTDENNTYIDLDNNFKIGIIKGITNTEYELKYIGSKKREQYRLEKISTLENKIEELNIILENLNENINKIDNSIEILNKEYKDEYKFNRISEKGLYKVRINFLDSKKVKLDLYIVER